MPRERILAVGLLTASDVKLLGIGFDRMWPVDDAPCFASLLQAIDEADRRLARDKDALSRRERQ